MILIPKNIKHILLPVFLIMLYVLMINLANQLFLKEEKHAVYKKIAKSESTEILSCL